MGGKMIKRTKYVIILKSAYYKLITSKFQTKSKSVKTTVEYCKTKKGLPGFCIKTVFKKINKT